LSAEQLVPLFTKHKANPSVLAHIKGYSNFLLMKREKEAIKGMDSSTWNPLIWAVFFGQNNIVQQILEKDGLVSELQDK